MKRSFNEQGVREALGRILRDSPVAGDGKLVLEALENVREFVPHKLFDACALQAEWGRRKLAHDLIEIGREEFERVTTEPSLPGAGTPGIGSRPGSSIGERTGIPASIANRVASRRRGPRFTPN